jgi:hypothetical protein
MRVPWKPTEMGDRLSERRTGLPREVPLSEVQEDLPRHAETRNLRTSRKGEATCSAERMEEGKQA